MYFGLRGRGGEHKQPPAPEAENDFTHSISLASIMTVRQHGELPASKSDAKDCDVTSDSSTEGWMMCFLKSTPALTSHSTVDIALIFTVEKEKIHVLCFKGTSTC